MGITILDPSKENFKNQLAESQEKNRRLEADLERLREQLNLNTHKKKIDGEKFAGRLILLSSASYAQAPGPIKDRVFSIIMLKKP